MIRNQQSIKLLVQTPKLSIQRVFSAQPSVSENSTKFEEEWAAAKPYSEIPTLSKFALTRNFLPGGRYYKISMFEMHKKLHADFGKIVQFPGMLGRKEIVISFDPHDIEKVFRTEGVWPNRRELETLNYYRKQIRPDIYGEVGGLFTE